MKSPASTLTKLITITMQIKAKNYILRIREYTTISEVIDFVTYYQNLCGENLTLCKVEKVKGKWIVYITVLENE